VTLLATADSTGASIADIDGSTWDPWAQRLLFTTESPGAPTYAATPGYPSTVTDVSGALGRGGYEGIQNDSQGNIWIVEDTGGSNNPGTVAKRPNSFVYRYVPAQPGDLQHGKLEALQVLNAAGDPITFESQAPLNSADAVALHTYGQSFRTKWVLVHDTAVSNTPFNANDVAKAAHATPFKRPENGAFRPGSKFTEFYFDETGDTNATSVENDTAGGWGSVMKLTQASPGADTGSLTLFYKANIATAGFDNVTFLSRDKLTFVQDAGDTLHGQANALDSGFVFDATAATRIRPISRCAGSPRAVTRRRRSTRRACRAATRSPACTSPTATRRSTGSSGRRSRSSSTTRTGAGSGRSSTATTTRGRSFRPPATS